MDEHSFLKQIYHRALRTLRAYDAEFREAQVYRKVIPLSIVGGALLFSLYLITFAPPLNFPTSLLIKIPRGVSVGEASSILKEKNVIYSTTFFEIANRLQPGGNKVVAGEYFFAGPQNVFMVAWRLARGEHDLTPVKIRIPDGARAKEITQLFDKEIPDFNREAFFAMALPKEGRLFPDTYFFLPGEDADVMLDALENNFERHIEEKTVADAIKKFGKPLGDVLTMASLLEKEASVTADRQVIAGILWKRVAIGMPLQVDAVFPYIIGVGSLNLTSVQLKTDSPYNTYTNKGLPPGPIANPSIDAIVAAVTPTKSNYLYYLSDKNGVFHYASTYAGHLANKRKYLGN
jgi:UPF0755 protein